MTVQRITNFKLNFELKQKGNQVSSINPSLDLLLVPRNLDVICENMSKRALSNLAFLQIMSVDIS